MKTMKKISMILSATLAVFALASCKQDININPADGETVVGSIPFELAASADEFATRTALDATTWNVSWESATQRPDAKADSIYVVTTDEAWGADGDAPTAAAFGFNGSTFSTESTIADGEHTFYFLYSNNGQKKYHRTSGTTHQLYANQSMDATAPTAGLRAYDALAGKVTVKTPAPIASVVMSHLYSLMKVTLKNQTGADMTVTSFSMTVAEGTYLNGINAVGFSGETPVATYNKKGSNVVTVNIANGEIKAGATLDVYFVILPLTNYSGDVTFQVATASDTYTKTNTVSALSFAAGSHNSASYTLKNADAKVTEPVGKTGWYRVEDASWLKAGDKVAIVAPDESLAMSTTQNANNRGSVSIVKGTDGDYQTFTSSSSDYQIFVLEAGTKDESFAFKCSNGAQEGKYIYASSSEKNNLLSKDDKDANASFTVSVLSGLATVIAQGENTRNYLKFNINTQNNNPIFSCYASSSTLPAVSIYKQYGEAASYTLTVDPNTVNGTIDADPKGSVQAGTNVTLTATPADGYVLDAWSVKDEAGADAATVVNNTFSMPAKNVTVSATFKSATAVDFTTIAELKAKITGDAEVTLTGTLSGVIVTYVNGVNAFLKDATGSILFYNSGHGLKQGQTFTGSITELKAKVFKGLREITEIDFAEGDGFEGDEAAVSPVTVTLADLFGHYDDYESEYVKVENLVSGTSATDARSTIDVSQGDYSYKVYTNVAIAVNTGDVFSATGTITKYNTTEELKVWTADGIVKDGSTPVVVEPTIEASDITDVAAAGVTDATATVTISNADGYDLAVTCDETVVTEASLDGSTLTYSVSENTTTDVRNGSITISLTKTGSTPVEKTITVSQLAASGGGDEPKTSTLNFTAKCDGSGTADDNVAWTVSSDGTESNFDTSKGIHYGTGKAAVQYITLSTSGISGTISKVVVNASTASGVTATVGVTVGGNAFGGDAQSLTSSAADYTFEGSASGTIIVTVTKPASATGALYVKSIAVTYLSGSGGGTGGEVPTATVVTGEASEIAADKATLNGSYSGATGTITETGFEYGTSSSLGSSVSASTNASFSAVLSNLAASTTYYFRAYAKESVGGVTSTRYGDVQTFTTTSGGSTTGGKYVKVTAASDLVYGESQKYLIVYEGTVVSKALDGSQTTAADMKKGFEVTISSGEIAATDAINAKAVFIVTDESSDFVLKAASGVYFYNTSSTSNGFSVNQDLTTANKYKVAVSFEESGAANITAAGSYLRWNSGSSIFNFYKASSYTSQEPIALYKYVEGSN